LQEFEEFKNRSQEPESRSQEIGVSAAKLRLGIGRPGGEPLWNIIGHPAIFASTRG
jgi:hypothetical protein